MAVSIVVDAEPRVFVCVEHEVRSPYVSCEAPRTLWCMSYSQR